MPCLLDAERGGTRKDRALDPGKTGDRADRPRHRSSHFGRVVLDHPPRSGESEYRSLVEPRFAPFREIYRRRLKRRRRRPPAARRRQLRRCRSIYPAPYLRIGPRPPRSHWAQKVATSGPHNHRMRRSPRPVQFSHGARERILSRAILPFWFAKSCSSGGALRPHGSASILIEEALSATTPTETYRRGGPKGTERQAISRIPSFDVGQVLSLGVKMRNTRCEQMFSAMTPMNGHRSIQSA